MTELDDVVVGCITGYDFKTIAPWVNSLDASGFKGKKVLICYNIEKSVIDELIGRGYTILGFNQDDAGNMVYKDGRPFSIVVERFFHIWALFKDLKGKHRYLLHTDVKDVIFQKNPSIYMDYTFGGLASIMAASESIQYENEDWGNENLRASFGEVIFEAYRDVWISNAGTLCGRFDVILDFFLNVYMVSAGGKTHNPDQAAVNILLNSEAFKHLVQFTPPTTGWACQAGTTNDPTKIGKYRPYLTKGHEGAFWNPETQTVDFPGVGLFYIVHQYDRVPEWRDGIMKKYGNTTKPSVWQTTTK